jgi:hypothetical protein
MKNNKGKTTGGSSVKQAKQQQDPDGIIMDMPEVKDIPGQEHVKVPQFREMQDTTISSADEEGAGILDDLNTDKTPVTNDNTSDVSRQEKKLLKKSAGPQPTGETTDFNKLALDERDNDGELLNEKSIHSDRNGEDLDVPGAELDDDDENIGEEDEENNMYSQSQRDN